MFTVFRFQKIVLEKLVVAVFFMIVAFYGVPSWQLEDILHTPLKDANYLARMSFVIITMFFIRCQYYFAWVCGE